MTYYHTTLPQQITAILMWLSGTKSIRGSKLSWDKSFWKSEKLDHFPRSYNNDQLITVQENWVS